MNYKMNQACQLVGCSIMTLTKLLKNSYIKPIQEIERGRNVTKLNVKMINELNILKAKQDEYTRFKRSRSYGNKYIPNKYNEIQKSDPTQTFNRVKSSKYFNFFSKQFGDVA